MIAAMLRGAFRAALAAYFRRIDVDGRARVPRRGPVLVVSNHVNALVDPLVLQVALGRPLTMTAKSTLAKNPLVRALMRGLNVVALHRAQDRAEGADPTRNAGALDECARRLAQGAAVCIFPEGVSHSDPAMRPFRTGAARLALEYAAAGNADLVVVPVGLHYDAKDTWRSDVWVRVGESFPLAAWLAANPAAAADALTAELDRRVRAVTLNFERRAESTLLTWAAELLLTGAAPPAMLGREDRDAPSLADRVAMMERLQAGYARLADTPEVDALSRRVRAWRSGLAHLGVTPAEVFLPMSAWRAAFFVVRELELLLVGLPLAAWGTLNHAPSYYLLRAIARRLSRDRDHWASNTVLPGVAVVPFFWALQIAIAFAVLPLPWALLYALVLPFSGAYAVLYRDRAGGIARRTRTFLRFATDRALQRRLAEEGRAIVREVESLEPRARDAVAARGT